MRVGLWGLKAALDRHRIKATHGLLRRNALAGPAAPIQT
jgi:hypothetical protein